MKISEIVPTAAGVITSIYLNQHIVFILYQAVVSTTVDVLFQLKAELETNSEQIR